MRLSEGEGGEAVQLAIAAAARTACLTVKPSLSKMLTASWLIFSMRRTVMSLGA